MQAAYQNELDESLHTHTLLRLYKMTNAELTIHRKQLLALRANLQGDMTKVEGDALDDHSRSTSIPTDMEEIGSENAEQEITLSLLGSDEAILDQIEAAIERIEGGSYGRCTTCGEKIPKNRLDAIPYAANCMKCASQQEVGYGAEPHCGHGLRTDLLT